MAKKLLTHNELNNDKLKNLFHDYKRTVNQARLARCSVLENNLDRYINKFIAPYERAEHELVFHLNYLLNKK